MRGFFAFASSAGKLGRFRDWRRASESLANPSGTHFFLCLRTKVEGLFGEFSGQMVTRNI